MSDLVYNPKYRFSIDEAHVWLMFSSDVSIQITRMTKFWPQSSVTNIGFISSMRVHMKPDFCICENKDADQLHSSHEADQRLCFRYTDSKIPQLPKSKFQASRVAIFRGLCQTWSQTPNTGFLSTNLMFAQCLVLMCLYRLLG